MTEETAPSTVPAHDEVPTEAASIVIILLPVGNWLSRLVVAVRERLVRPRAGAGRSSF
jgi:hypothetical protein